MSSPKIALSEVAQVNPAINPREFPRDTDVSFVPMSAVSEVTLRIEGEVTRKLNEVNKQYTPFRKGDILIAKITPSFENGKLTIADIRHELGFGTTEFHVVRPTKSILDTRYLFHFLKQDAIRSAGAKRMTGSAGQKRLPASFVAGLQIPLPPLAEQRRIAAMFDKVDELRALRRQALARLDDLAQSVFFEMFGDPIANKKGWPIVKLGEVVRTTSGGTPLRERREFYNGSIPWVKSGELRDTFINETEEHISEAGLESSSAKIFERGTILIALYGATVGKMGILNIKAATNQAVCALFPSANIAALFLFSLFLYSRDSLLASRVGGAQPNISQGVLRNWPIILPPIELQHKHEQIFHAIFKERSRLSRSGKLLDDLASSVSNYFFLANV